MTIGRRHMEPNEHYVDSEGTVHVKLTQGKEALVSQVDYPKVAPYRWFAVRSYGLKHKTTFYALAAIGYTNGKQVKIRMHSLILDTPQGFEVDHKFGDGLDNRRGMILNVTHRVNCQNRQHPRSSRYPGVSWHKQTSKWRATIVTGRKQTYLGLFSSELDAAAAYRKALTEVTNGTT